MAHQTVGNAAANSAAIAAADELIPGLPADPRAEAPAPSPACPVEITLAALRGRWTTLVVRELLRRPSYAYSELAAALPRLSDKVLSDRLAQLVAAGVVERHRTKAWPPTVTYQLTDHGRELGPVLQALWDWGTDSSSERLSHDR
ncbi:winged helix-turn-helix transcriptional regulator [Streptomyces sp. NBC_01304]|uniref:winged helix-turn-helix transcriptional regulator n=1 Tax=Streptomyces sp. NBC_01304 TaxID=2903818 RepID=UPI002E123159|nr:helix-turn-helix transcriptional regulator [Streptomyces sp. NBC_01304]